MKSTILIFYANDGGAAKTRAKVVTAEGKYAGIRQTIAYGGETEPCDAVVIMPDVGEHDRARIAAAYGDKVQRPAAPKPAEEAPKPKLGLPPPPPPVEQRRK